jgi:hypothetical protein
MDELRELDLAIYSGEVFNSEYEHKLPLNYSDQKIRN